MIRGRSFTRPPALRRGLSLIEVLLALVILVLSLAAISQLVDMGTERARDSRAATRGTRLAQGKMAEVEAGVVSLSSPTEGEFTDEDAGWMFSVTPEMTGPPNLYTVTVKVTRDVQGKIYEVVLAQMVFDPTKTGSARRPSRPPPPDPADTTGVTTP